MRTLPLLLLAFGCGGAGPKPDEPARCDGVYQAADGDYTDAIFDADGDGFPDANIPECREHYSRLDCDDSDPNVHPDAIEKPCNGIDDDCNELTPDSVDADNDGVSSCDDCDDHDGNRSPEHEEICWDGIDNNCDGEVDEGCGENYTATYALDQRVHYQCAVGSVVIDFHQLAFFHHQQGLSALPVGAGVQPHSLDGDFTDEEGGFELVDYNVFGTAGSCDEYYRLRGVFTSPDTFEGIFEIAFVGGLACLNCNNRQWTVSGVRTDETIP